LHYELIVFHIERVALYKQIKMPDLSLLMTPAPYHILTYGTLLGMEFYQSFVAGVVAFRALTRPQFGTLQNKVFPVYFSLQTALPVILALTYPGSPSSVGTPSSLPGVLAESNRWSVLVPLVTVVSTSLLNMFVAGPAVQKVMQDRKIQETRDGKKSYDPPPHSKEMQQLNKAFGKMHGISSLLNLVSFLATVGYGLTIAARIQ